MPYDQSDVAATFDILVGWMEKDIQAMINARSNFAAALCMLAYSEALGRFRNATIGDGSNTAARQAFEYFLEHMGYTSAEANIIYSNLRNGMAHSYFPNKDMQFIMEGGTKGIDSTVPTDVKLYVKKTFDEFKNAIPRVRIDINNPAASLNIVNNLRTRIGAGSSVSAPTSLSMWVTTRSGV